MKYWIIKSGLLVMASCMFMAVSLYPIRGEAVALSGKLVYGQSNSIHVLDLSTMKDHIVYEERKEFSIFNHLTKVDDRSLLVEDDSHHLIKELDLKTGSVKKVRSGYSPQFNVDHQKLFFYNRLPDKAQVGLFIADLKDPIASARLVHKGPFPIPTQVIQVSKDDVIFSYEEKVLKYSIITGALEKLPIKNCALPKIMRSATDQLLCFDTSAQHYFLSSIDGRNIEYISSLESSSSAAFYLSKYDALIFSKARFSLVPPLGEVNDIWLYNFRADKKTRLKKSATIGLGAAVWVE